MNKTFGVIGGDRRQAELARLLAGDGHSVRTYGLDRWPPVGAAKLDRAAAASLLPKSVTTAIGADVSGELGGVPALATAVIILTGIFGNLAAQAVCRLFRITDPVAKGVGIGSAAHAIGTARALEMGPVEGAMSSLSIAVAGILTALLCPLAVNLLP